MDNGHAKPLTNPKDGSRIWTLIISKDYDAIKVTIGGEMPNLDEGISVLAQAIRALEFEQKKAQALELQAALAEAARTKAIVDHVGKTGMRG